MPFLRNQVIVSVAAGLLAVAGYCGIGLHAWWPVAWVMPFLAFVAAARVSGWRRLLVTMVPFFVGSLNLWSYLSILPPLIRILVLLIPAVAFGATAALFGALVARQHTWLALILPAAFFVTYEYGYSLLSPHSTFGAWGYTQVDCLPILQLSSAGGLWLIDGLIFFVAAGAALLVGPVIGPRKGTLALITTIPLALAVLFGVWRLHMPTAGPSLRVGLLASDRPESTWYMGQPTSEVVLQHYVAQIPRLAAAGAELILLPEHLIGMRESGPAENAGRVDRVLQEAAARAAVPIVIGLDRFDAHGTAWNEARAYFPDGRVIRYDKHHLLPGAESMFTPGATYSVMAVADRKLGLAICKDLDFPATGRDYARLGIGTLIVPAYDFSIDRWLHGRMAVERAVEAGFSLVRCAKRGLLTVADNRGRILAEATSADGAFGELVATVPVTPEWTLYAHAGDWFAWLCVVALLVSAARLIRKR